MIDKEKRIQEIINKPRMWNHEGLPDEKQQHGDELYRMIEEYFNENFIMVEIGSYSGGSTEFFALCCKKVYCVDKWADNDNPIQEGLDMEKALSNLRKAEAIFDERIMDVYNNVQKIRELSTEAYKYFEDESLDAIYIDGNHRYDNVCKDIQLWFPKIRKGGIISGHDYYHNIKLAVNNTLGEPLETYGDTSWLFVKDDNLYVRS